MKKTLYILAITTIIIFGNINIANASHFAGADLTYTCLGGSSYEITLSFYRDCSGIPAPNTATIRFACSSNPIFNFNVQLNQIVGSGSEITPGCPQVPTSCAGGGNGAYGIREYVYQGTVTMPPCDEWSMYWSGGARNPITTLMGYGNWYIPAQLNNLDAPCNSSPTFSNKPIAVTCLNQHFTFNHGAIDPDGDSLSYSFYAPYTSGPNLVSVIYNLPFNATSFIPSSTGIQLDAVTGDVSFTPTQILNTITGIRVDEWREINGVMKKIGSVYRDIQLKVVACNNTLPVLSGMDTTLSATYNPNDTTYYLELCRTTDPIKFHINGHDSDSFDPTTTGSPEIFNLTWDNGIPGASFNIYSNNTDSAYAEFEWLPTGDDVSTIPKCFTVTVKDSACAYNGVQTFSYCLVVRGMLVEIGTDTLLCKGEDIIVRADADTTTVNYVWMMNGTPTGTPMVQDSIIINSSTLTEGNNILSIETNDGTTTMDCPGTDKININVVYQPEINGTLPDSAFCSPGTVLYDAGQGTLYNWTNFSGASIGTSQTFTAQNSGVYSVFVDGGTNTRCIDKDTFIVASIVMPDEITDTCIWAADAPYLLDIDSESPQMVGDMTFEWNTGNPDDTTSAIEINHSGEYSVSVSNPKISTDVKCKSTGTINIIDQDNIIQGIPYQAGEDTPMPDATWTAGDQKVCAYQKVRFKGPTPPAGHTYNYFWKEDGSLVSSSNFYFFLKKENGVHELSLNVGGCEDKVTVETVSCDVKIPNIITPNGDGINDKFRIMLVGEGAPEFFSTFPNSTLIVYNRWGKKVYESNNYQNEWDGDNLTDGVYYWNLFLADGKDTEMNGSITILR